MISHAADSVTVAETSGQPYGDPVNSVKAIVRRRDELRLSGL
jgi:hypothetical protein